MLGNLDMQYPDDRFESPSNEDSVFFESDVRSIDTLALNRPFVLSAVCRVMGLHLSTEWFTSGKTKDLWTVSGSKWPSFTGQMHEVIIFVKGYASAWIAGRHKMREQLQEISTVLQKHTESL